MTLESKTTDFEDLRGLYPAGGPTPAIRRGLAWPAPGAWRTYLAYGLSIDALFFLVYGGCNWISAQRTERFHLYFDWELSIPFVPSMIWIYVSMLVLFLFPLFQLDERNMPRLGRQILIGTVIAGCVFLAMPAELGFSRAADAGDYAQAYKLLYAIDLPHNLVPALHIVFSALIVFSLMEAASPALRFGYALWLALITVSVLLVHQHHLADVMGGYALAWLCRRLVPERNSYLGHQPVLNNLQGERPMFYRITAILILLIGLLAPIAVSAQDQGDAYTKDHEQLRELLVSLRDAVNAKQFEALDQNFYSTFSVTTVDQSVLTTGDEIKTFFERWFGGDDAFIKNFTMNPEADKLTQIYGGKIGVVRGRNTESYELATGKTYTIKSRWTATLIKDDGRWKILTIHNGVNFVDNPVLAAVEQASLYLGIGGILAGLLAGLFFGWFFRFARR